MKFILSFLLLISNLSFAQIDGYLKSFTILNDYSHYPFSFSTQSNSTQKFRINYQKKYSHFYLSISYELSHNIILSSSNSSSLRSFQQIPTSLRILDIKPNTQISDSNTLFVHNIDRLSVNYYHKYFEINLGRQVISFGSSKFLNPIDLFTPLNFQDLDRENRAGVDALRFKIPFGRLNEIDSGFIFGKDNDKVLVNYFIKPRVNFLGTDFQIILAYRNKNYLLGFDLAGSLGLFGFWIEVGFDLYDTQIDFSKEKSIRLNSGVDISFLSNFYLIFEYHYNSLGDLKAENYLILFSKTSYQNSKTSYLNKHYLSMSLNFQATPLIGLSLFSLNNIVDFSGMISLSLNWEIEQNTSLTLGTFINYGEVNNYANVSEISKKTLKSEFGISPKIIYLNFKIYF